MNFNNIFYLTQQHPDSKFQRVINNQLLRAGLHCFLYKAFQSAGGGYSVRSTLPLGLALVQVLSSGVAGGLGTGQCGPGVR